MVKAHRKIDVLDEIYGGDVFPWYTNFRGTNRIIFLECHSLVKNEEWHFVIYPYKGLIIPAA